MKRRVLVLLAAVFTLGVSLTVVAPHADAAGWCDKGRLCMWTNATYSGPASTTLTSPHLGCYAIPTAYRNKIKSVYNYSGYDFIVYATTNCNATNQSSPTSIFYSWRQGKMNPYWSGHVASVWGLPYYHKP